MAGGKYDVYAAQCPTRQALDRIADKWTALIVGLLAERTHRFGELRRSIEGISHKVLVQTLRSLERDGLVHRQPLPTKPPTVEYSLTALGRTLVGPLASIRDWAELHIEELQSARDAYTSEHPAQKRAGSTRVTESRPASAHKHAHSGNRLRPCWRRCKLRMSREWTRARIRKAST
jgi:DNA-binding HxlR family transcriptional regulator